MRRNFKFRVFVPLVLVYVVLLVFVPNTPKWGYDYTKGQAWQYEPLVAQFDFPILKSEAQITRERAEKATTIVPYYKLSGEYIAGNLKKLETLPLEDVPEFKVSVAKNYFAIMNRGVLAMPIEDELIYVQRNKRAERIPSSEVYQVAQAKVALLESVVKDCPAVNVDSLLRINQIYEWVTPDLIFDEQITTLVHSKAEAEISTTSGYVTAGTLIVDSGELVTNEVAELLDSYKVEYEHSVGSDRPRLMQWGGNMLLVLLILVCLYFAIYFSNAMVFKDYNRYYFLLTVFTFLAVVELLFIRFAPSYIFCFPFSVGVLYLYSFFRTRVVYPVYMASLLPLLLFGQDGPYLFFLFLVSGTVTMYVFKHFSKGVKQFIAAFINFLVATLVFLAFELLGAMNYPVLPYMGMLFIGSILEVAMHPFVYLLERTFNLVSSTRLQELTDTSNELLRNLEQKAPGTFQHSLQVMNLASAAARSINADELLVRAGALYHDIGKMKNPLCFVENESLVGKIGQYHKELAPLQSAQDIMRHVTDGMELAQAHKLPSVVSDFIVTHHGTTCTNSFYAKYKAEGGDPSHRHEFCYQGRVPKTREQVILMLADSVEAASRSLEDHKTESISKLVENIARGKSEEGQFDMADITLKELVTVKSVMKSYLAQMYHERIKYPTRINK